MIVICMRYHCMGTPTSGKEGEGPPIGFRREARQGVRD